MVPMACQHHHRCVKTTTTTTTKRQLVFFGHILWLPEEEPAKRYALDIPSDGQGRPGRPQTSYRAHIQRVLGMMKMTWEQRK